MIISKTPLRASFFGGGTDFAGYYENSKFGYGTVLSTALNMYIYIIVNKRFDNHIMVRYSKNEFVDSVDEIEHNIIREALKITGITKGIEIMYSADIPVASSGIGLASSSAMAVGVLNALHAYKGEHVSADQLAKEACEIEIDRLKNPIGVQDQYAVACGGFKQYKFWNSGIVTREDVTINRGTIQKLHNSLLLYFTGMTRISSDILSEQKDNIEDKMQMLDEMVEMTNDAVDAVRSGNIDCIGKMLDEAWNKKKSLASKISNSDIDEMYEKALNAGAKGGKILGAGGGGFLLLFVDADKKKMVEEAMKEYKKVEFNFEPEGSRILFVEDVRG